MIKDLMRKVVQERKEKDIQDDYGIQKCWNKMIEILSRNVQDTIEYLENCSEEDLFYISEIFEDVSERLKSKEYIICLRKLDKKFPQLNMSSDIDLAEKYL